MLLDLSYTSKYLSVKKLILLLPIIYSDSFYIMWEINMEINIQFRGFVVVGYNFLSSGLP